MTKKILIVEDEENILELLSIEFGDRGDYEIFCARNGEEALRIARSNNPDIILLDILIPKLDGYEVCRSVKSDPDLSRTKVIIISGIVQHSVQQKSRKVGADAYIAKPFDLVEVVGKVEELLESK